MLIGKHSVSSRHVLPGGGIRVITGNCWDYLAGLRQVPGLPVDLDAVAGLGMPQ
jgi:hypothetical protein